MKNQAGLANHTTKIQIFQNCFTGLYFRASRSLHKIL